jgi:predicted ATP-binding protein involved in virulence
MITSFKTEGLSIGFDFDIDLEKDKPIYCFIGKNGIGKTQLLENMAKGLIFSHSIVNKDRKFKFNWMSKYLDFIDTTFNFVKINDITMRKEYGWHLNVSSIVDKPIIFIGAKNRGFTDNIDTHNIKLLSNKEGRFVESFERTLKYLDGAGLQQTEIADWFASRLIINPNFITQSQNKVYEASTVLKLIERLEPSIKLVGKNIDGSDKLDVSFYEGKLLINNIPLDKLSTGYISIIKIFQEIVAGYGGWTNEENLNEVEGIVFIDELEPHLHISWQTKIIKILREFFPKTTFYISTHSPLVLAGLKDGEGYELVREGGIVKSKRIANIENYFLNDIVKEFFDVDLNQQRIDNVDKEKQNKAKALLLNLINSAKDEAQ